jgi:ketosteroid isomerase-like protein
LAGVSQENVEIARLVLDARNRGDVAAMLPHAAPDIEFDFTASDGPWAGTHHGRERLLESFDSLSEAFDELRWEAEEFIDAGDAVVVPCASSPAAAKAASRPPRAEFRSTGSGTARWRATSCATHAPTP